MRTVCQENCELPVEAAKESLQFGRKHPWEDGKIRCFDAKNPLNFPLGNRVLCDLSVQSRFQCLDRCWLQTRVCPSKYSHMSYLLLVHIDFIYCLWNNVNPDETKPWLLGAAPQVSYR